MKKTFSFLLALCLLLSLMPVGAYAAEAGALPAGGQGEISASGTLDIDESVLPDSQEILDSYALNMLYPQYTMSLFSLGPDKLGDARQQYIYSQLKDWITRVAQGESPAYLKMEIPSTPELSWTYDELGISDPNAQDLKEIFYDKAGINKVIETLMVDMPYELYWFDKSEGNGASCYFSLNYDGSRVKLTGIEFIFSVIESYKSSEAKTVTWGGSEKTYYSVNSTRFNSVEKAVAKAQSIVNSYAAQGDYEKLTAYKNEICALTDYDYNAANTAPTEYGDPWQIINVFDGDPNTKVVCEGYSKAFQYLCDKSSFQDINTVCYTAMGYLSGGGLSKSEGHMWNIVSLGGRSYLADVTNSDEGTKGASGQLFLAGASGSPENGYSIIIGNETLRYTYDLMSQDMKDMLGDALVLSDKSYDPNGATEPECSHEWVESGVNKAASCTEAGEMGYECSKCGETKTEPIEALGHDWSGWTSADENNHSRTCLREGCGATETGDHSFVEGKCSVCGYEEPKEEHQHSYGQWQTNETQHWRVCSDASCNNEERGDHSFVEGKCSVCGYEEPKEEHQHSYGQWQTNETQHWRVCSDGAWGPQLRRRQVQHMRL